MTHWKWKNIDSLTTGQASEILGLSGKTVVDLANKGLLKAWKVPGSNHRRFRAVDIREFQVSIGAPTEKVELLLAWGAEVGP